MLMFLRKGIRLTWLAAAILCAFPSPATAQQKSLPPAEPVTNQLRTPAADSPQAAPILRKPGVSQTAASAEPKPQQESTTNNAPVKPRPPEQVPFEAETSQAAGTNQTAPSLARTRQASAPPTVRTASRSIRSLPSIEETPVLPAMPQEEVSLPSKQTEERQTTPATKQPKQTIRSLPQIASEWDVPVPEPPQKQVPKGMNIVRETEPVISPENTPESTLKTPTKTIQPLPPLDNVLEAPPVSISETEQSFKPSLEIPQQTESKLIPSRAGKPRVLNIKLVTETPEDPDPNSMWWHAKVIEPIDQRDIELINPNALLHHALHNSPLILAISKSPLIRQTAVGEACGKFDPEIFVLSQFDDRYDPVGNTLTTGNSSSFLKDHLWSGDMGVRRKMQNGGSIEARQQFGFQNSNSSFFQPQDQGTATLSLNFAQPLMKGRGAAYNRNQILIAQLDSTASWDEFASELQDELTQIVEAYWTLYFHRALLLQKENNVKRGEVVLQKLEARSGLDSLPSQIARARSAVQLRRTELANARRDIKNAETNIRRLIGSVENFQAIAPELLPEEAPSLIEPNRDLAAVIEQAIQLRPEIKRAIQRGKIAAVQKRVSEHELMPELNLIFNTYVSALQGDSDILGAWGEQFTGSTPGYGVGFEFNTPYYRRAARSANKRQQYFLDQVRHEIDQTVNNIVAEAQIAWREVDSAYQTVISAAEAIRAARTDLLQNEARWNSFALVEGDFSDGQNPTTLLDQLLDAQQRLSNAELTYSQSLLEFKRSEVELKRATGELLNHQEVSSIGYSTPWQSGEVIPTPDPHSQNLPPSGNLPMPAQR